MGRLLGDTGAGKSSIIRQMLIEIERRGETAIVYDPGPEYINQFYSPKRGDVILNPLDARMPYWSPADEVLHEAEAATLAASLFPEQFGNPFFITAPRRIFAHLLTLEPRPTPAQLVKWLSDDQELDRKLKGSDLAGLMYQSAAGEYWGNSYSYDAWGNLLSKNVTKCSAENLNVTALANNQLSGYSVACPELEDEGTQPGT